MDTGEWKLKVYKMISFIKKYLTNYEKVWIENNIFQLLIDIRVSKNPRIVGTSWPSDKAICNK